ncbi:MAG: outer membrane lipid asymmetry maintenance protein MlaD [Pseudoprimorskyibacter sp.]|jgi:phospholipid/cholesterol/gamma-HCH transport system substrate-binding protein|nr:outer membrane lipid asymmetry maintenance protein MlaD [Pseudoprimorskyibacter sp.]
MARQSLEIVVGALVLVVAFGFGAYTFQKTGAGRVSEGYPLSASFRSIEGVNTGTEVRLAGVPIGSVSKIVLNTETYRADVVLEIESAVQIPDDSAAIIASEGLLGGNFVEISPGGSPFYFGSGDEILDTQGSVSLLTLLMRFVGGDN